MIKIPQPQGIDFGRFTLHMMPNIVLSFLATIVYIRFWYRDLPNHEFKDDSQNDIESGECP